MSDLSLHLPRLPRLRSLGVVNTVLSALVVLVVAALVAVLVGGSKVLPWTTPATNQAQQYAAVQSAAKSAMLTFLDVDYRSVDQEIAAVKAASTGAFLKQYSSAAVELKAALQQAQSVATGTVDYVGITGVSGDTATAMVAADVVVANNATKTRKATAACPHAGAQCDQYRFAVTLTGTASGWKMSNLVGVS